MTAIPDGSNEDVLGCLLGYHWAIENGDIPEAQKLLDRARKGRSHALQQIKIGFETAYLEARYFRNAEPGRAWLMSHPPEIYPEIVHRGEAAVMLAEGDAVGALRKAQEVLAESSPIDPWDAGRLTEIVAASQTGLCQNSVIR